MTHQAVLLRLNLLPKLPPRIISDDRLDLYQQVLKRLNVLPRALHIAMTFAEQTPPVSLVIGDGYHETGDAVVVCVEGDDADAG